jgi:ubiquinol-cytochrome c reductase cytochrome b subunit
MSSTKSRIFSHERIGPHNLDIISIIYGSLLGDSHLEKRGSGIRLKFEQSNNNVEYLMWFFNYFADRGYCNPLKPKIKQRFRPEISKNLLFHYAFNTYSYKSFQDIYNDFYQLDDHGKYFKIVPLNIQNFLNPLA